MEITEPEGEFIMRLGADYEVLCGFIPEELMDRVRNHRKERLELDAEVDTYLKPIQEFRI